MNNSMSGTTIMDLRKQKEIDELKKKHELGNYNDGRMTQYNANQNLQYEQGHNDAYDVTQVQQDPYYRMQNVSGYPSNPEISNNMIKLNNKISSTMPEKKYSDDDIISDIIKEEFESEKENDSKINYNTIIKESIIILVIYMILSLPVVQKNIGKLIPMINPGYNGSLSMSAVLIYGIILVILVALVKNLLKRY